MNKEEWRPIKGYQGLYEISNLGRVKSFYCNREKVLKPGKKRGNIPIGEDHWCARLKAEDIKIIRDWLSSGKKQSEIAEHFNVSSVNISNIKNRKVWKHI